MCEEEAKIRYAEDSFNIPIRLQMSVTLIVLAGGKVSINHAFRSNDETPRNVSSIVFVGESK